MVSVRFRFLKKSPVTVRLRFSQSQKLRLRFGFGLHEKWPENRVFGFGSVNRSFPSLYFEYKTLLKFSCILAVIKVLKLCHENRDFWLNREKHIVALASAETKTASFAHPRALRALGLACFGHSRALRALEWLSPMFLGPSGNTAA